MKPKKVIVLGTEFKVEYIDDLPCGQYGECQGWERKIKLSSKMSKKDMDASLMHEIIHAIFHVTGWSEKLGSEEEEGIVRALEHGLGPLYKFKEK